MSADEEVIARTIARMIAQALHPSVSPDEVVSPQIVRLNPDGLFLIPRSVFEHTTYLWELYKPAGEALAAYIDPPKPGAGE